MMTSRSKEDIRKQALKELEDELFEKEVLKEKEKLKLELFEKGALKEKEAESQDIKEVVPKRKKSLLRKIFS